MAWVKSGNIKGPQGLQGATGGQGVPGVAGPPGADSTVPGPSGPPGSAGPAGAAATVAAGTTTTGAPGSAANVVNTGTSSAAVFAFTIPRGDAGVPGSDGAPGNPGLSGPSGLNAWTLVTNASFTVPAYGASVTINAGDTSWVALGEWVYVDDANGTGVAGQLIVSAKTPTTLTLFNPTSTTYPLADTTQNGLLRKVSGNTSDFIDGTNNCQPIVPQITAVRLRSFNAIGNPNFEVDQVSVGAPITAANTKTIDRWATFKTGTMVASVGQAGVLVLLPGTNFSVSQNCLRVTLNTAQASLGASDQLFVRQQIEGPMWRELQSDIHSVSLLVRSSVAGLNFGLNLRDLPATKSLCKLCTVTSSGVWQLIQLPNLPLWPAGNFVNTPGVGGYQICVTLAAGSSNMAAANDIWQSGNFIGALGQSNYAASPVNSTFDIAFVQHEPGPLCTTLIDKPFSQNLDECLRYYTKSYDLSTLPGTVTNNGMLSFMSLTTQASGLGPVGFKKPMANVPTVTIYNHATGAAASVQDGAGVNHTGAAGSFPGNMGWGRLTFTTAVTANTVVYAHYTADTGW